MSDKDKYKEEYKKKFGEDLPDEVYDSPASKIRRKLKEIKDKMLSDKDNRKGGGLMKYKKGGKVKRMSCPVDGMAKRGKTKVRRKGR
jgi:hypothetical protein